MNAKLLSVVVLVASAGAAQADPIIIGVEDPANGFVGTLFPGFGDTSYLVASDGESPFRPFNIAVDVSDALNFDAVPFLWTMDAVTVGWTQAVDPTGAPRQTWYIDAIAAGENEGPIEPIGYFSSPVPWNDIAIGTFWILDPNEGSYDEIITWNDANGAHLSFNSDAPAPGSVALLGLGGFVAARRRRA